MTKLSLWEYAYMNNYEYWINELAENMARKERWHNTTDTTPHVHPILRSYIDHTFRRAQDLSRENADDGYLLITQDNICFDTGLFTINYESIYALFEKKKTETKLKWKFKGFYKESSHELLHISKLPKRVSYFSNIDELYYDTKYELRINYDHILSDPRNLDRIPQQYRELPNLAMTFKGTALTYAIIRIKENYKAAVPQYFNGKVQFLIPISLGSPSVVDLALAVGRVGDIYTGKTCLTLDMAYNNARLIARPETDWLTP